MTLNLEPIKARLDDLDYGRIRAVEISEYTHKPNLILTCDGDVVAEIHNDAEAILLTYAPTDIAALVEEVERLDRITDLQNSTIQSLSTYSQIYKKHISLLARIKTVCEQSNNSDGAYIKRLIEEMEGETNAAESK